MIINEGAKLSNPLKNGGFDIKTYQKNVIQDNLPVIDNTGVKLPPLPRAPARTNMQSLQGIEGLNYLRS